MAGPVGRPRHYSGTAAAAPSKIDLTKRGFSLVITNTDATNTMGVSFDGSNYFTIQPKTPSPVFECAFVRFWVNSASGAAWQAVVIEG